jgi:hypothetical protein
MSVYKGISNKLALSWMAQGMSEREFIDRHRSHMKQARVDHAANERLRRRANPEHTRMLMRQNYAKHIVKRRLGAKASYQARKQDPIRLARARKWATDYVRKKKASDPEFRIRFLMRNRIAMSLQRGVAKSGTTVELIGCTVPELRYHIESLWLPGMSWHNYGRGKGKWHIDHKRPCVSFKLSDPAEQRRCFHFSNLQPLWEEDNLRKGSKVL